MTAATQAAPTATPGPLAWLIQPVSEDQPCGPDLDAVGDAEFIDYYFDAEARMPERYFTPGIADQRGSIDRLFDPKSVELATETAQITALLKRSRDLRLVTLLARFQILAGRVQDFADTVTACADLIAARGDDAHPGREASTADRRAALESLAQRTTVLMPIQHLALTGHGDGTWRRHVASTGPDDMKRAGERDAKPDALPSALGDAGNRAAVDRNHAALGRAAQALSRIVGLSETGERPFRPDLEPVIGLINDIQAQIVAVRPDLRMWNADAATPDDAGDTATDDGPRLQMPPGMAADGAGAPVAPVAASVPDPAVPRFGDRRAVQAALESAERYLVRNEPSSPVLLLVTQARLLIGRPLIEALETLLPGDAGRAVIGFAPETGFSMPMDRLRSLSQAALGGFDDTDADAGEDPGDAAPPPRITSRPELAGVLRGVEEFYRQQEPASPIPILLARARGFMDKGFQSIVAELLPPPQDRG